ncbi:efflux RND transporter periplasmic adaptor subunit [Leptospira sp. 201903075]|uniref:efflux RND transporter periplasmic adaptor subunit n=1 Tax=Leptospira chreensis TaxID=2810035 RepID=UPI001963FE5D|nr:efflux RND transporter periplasmic adaptor subunit [Leptospira chreensis]MBM9592395.1 efflux RND transporter periplasmic adaptor subunit [Leptospira chreensis]
MKKIKAHYIILIFILVFCKKSKSTEETNKALDYGIISVSAIEPVDEILTLGSVSYLKKAEVTSKVLGRIENYFKEEGQKVNSGDTLAKIETLNLEIQLGKDKSSEVVQRRQVDLANAKLLMARQRVERELANIRKAEADVKDTKAVMENLERSVKNKKELMEIGAVSETELKSIQTSLNSAEVAYFKAQKNLENIIIGFRDKDLENAGIKIESPSNINDEKFIYLNTAIERAELEMAKANLEAIKKSVESTELLIKESNLKSPLTGIVATRAKEKGEAVKEGEPVFIVVDTSQVLLRFNVSESDAGFLQNGTSVKFTVDALGKEEMNGKIHIISPIIDPQSRSLEVKVIANNTNGKLRPGMFARGRIPSLQRKKQIVIPVTSIAKKVNEKSAIVFKLNDQDMFFEKQIQIVRETDDGIIIESGIEEGEKIATKNVNLIQEGDRLTKPKDK